MWGDWNVYVYCNQYLFKKLVREGGIPFEVVADPFYSMKNLAVLDSRIADIKAGKNIAEHELIEVE